MDIQLFFEAEASERKSIALTVNGKSVGLQTVNRDGKRVYIYNLVDYQQPVIDLTLTSLDGPANLMVIAVNNQQELRHLLFLDGAQGSVAISFDLVRAGWYKEADEKGIPGSWDTGITWTRPENPSMPDRSGGRRAPRRPTIGKAMKGRNADFKVDFDFYDRQTKKADLLVSKAEVTKATLVDVFYATDRARELKKKGMISYRNERGDLELGKCVVNVPGERKKGELPLPPWYYFGLYADESKHMLLKTVEKQDAKTFFASLQDKVSSSPEKDAFVFLHGFNVSFEESILRAAQMAVDIGFRGAPIVYSWPSAHKVFGYMADEATVTGYSVDNVIQLIKDVRVNTGAERVHLIAHSMGNRLLTEALKAMASEGFTKKFLFNQIILTAPDIDAEVFVKHIAPKISETAKQLTLYTSIHDKALWLSDKLHGDNLRAGTAAEQLAVCAGIDTIDASAESTGLLGHGYFAESKAMIDDIHQAIRFSHTPEERNLRKRVSGKLFYWDFN